MCTKNKHPRQSKTSQYSIGFVSKYICIRVSEFDSSAYKEFIKNNSLLFFITKRTLLKRLIPRKKKGKYYTCKISIQSFDLWKHWLQMQLMKRSTHYFILITIPLQWIISKQINLYKETIIDPHRYQLFLYY